MLATIGQLAQVSRISFRPFVADVLPLVIEAVQDASSMRKRLVAVKTLGQVGLSAWRGGGNFAFVAALRH